MRAEKIINKLKKKVKLTKEEITFMVHGYTNCEIDDETMGSFLLLIKNNGLSYEETAYLTEAMINTGDILDLSHINKVVVDKHSTGGVGDKVTFLVSPIVASLGIGIAKMSGRSLGFTGGTVDKLESIPGYKVKITNKKFIENVNNVGISLISQTGTLAPADKKIYALRDEIGAVESIPLIASSIMSKKIASGAPIIVIDLKVGSGAFMKSKSDATKLAKYMIKIGKYYNRKVVCILSDMNTPLGYSVGNSLEVEEAIDFFNGRREKRLEKLVITLSTYMVSLGLKVSLSKAKKLVIESLNNGKSRDKFYEWIANQGGNLDKLKTSKYEYNVVSLKDGYVTKINPIKVSEYVFSLGAGRLRKEDKIDYNVGVKLNKTLYSKVNKNDVLLTIYSNKKLGEFSKVLDIFKIESIKPKEKDIIISVIK